MTKQQFQRLIRYFGAELLNYILNRADITTQTTLDLISINDTQIGVLNDLYKRIEECMIQSIKQGWSDVENLEFDILLPDCESILSKYREKCGGVQENIKSKDSIVAYLQKLCIRNYPNLLITHKNKQVRKVRIDDINELVALIKEDSLGTITNNGEGLDCKFVFKTEDGNEFNTGVYEGFSDLITGAFLDACNRMDYSLPAVLETIERYVNSLRELAAEKEVEYSSFVGLKGIAFNGFDEIVFDGAILRQYLKIENPGIHTQKTIRSHCGQSQNSGHVLGAVDVSHRQPNKRASHGNDSFIISLQLVVS